MIMIYYYLFKDEYLNGERNGLGKEYYECEEQPKLIFEGEYLNSKKWNGKGYNNKNEVVNILVEGKGYIKIIIIIIVIFFLKENILMEKEMEKE